VLVRYWTAFNGFMTAPLWVTSASLMVATIPALQHWLQFHAAAVLGAIFSAGRCSIPITLIVLGAYFYPEPPEATNHGSNMTTSNSSAAASSPMPFHEGSSIWSIYCSDEASLEKKTETVIITVLSRMVLTHIVLMPLITFSVKYDFHALFEE